MIEEEIEDLLDEIDDLKNAPDKVAEKLAENIKNLEDAKDKQKEEQKKEIEELRRVLREAQITAALTGDGPATDAATEFMEEGVSFLTCRT
jgi:esterase/lipase